MTTKVDLTGLTRTELAELLKKIQEHLGLEMIDVRKEALRHYHRCNTAAATAAEMLERGEATAGTAAVLTAATGMLKELARLEEEMYNVEQFKIFEKAVQNTLRQAKDADLLLQILEEEIERGNT